MSSKYTENEIDRAQAELINVNFEIIQSSEEVRGHFAHSRGSTLLVIDSMSPMSDADGPKTRSAVVQALKDNPKQPRYRLTIMASVNREAVLAAEKYVQPYQTSAPAIALIVKDPRYVNGHYVNSHKTVFYKDRSQIEKQTAEEIATELRAALEQYHHAWYTPVNPDHLEEEVDHIQAELKQVNFEIIQSSEEVRGHFAHSRGSTLLVIDSMSPMSDSDGPKTRSAVIQALKDNPKQPRYRITIMAGVNRQAVLAADKYVQPYGTSTPTIALIVKDPRYVNDRYINGHKTVFHKNCFQIEKQTAEEIATELRAALEQYHHAWYTPIGPDHLEEEIDHIQAELKQVNFEIIQSSEEVRGHFAHSRGSTLLVIDSMSPMSDSDGPKTRSAVIQALKDNPKQPRYRITIMAGVNRQAVLAADKYVQPYGTSTPTIALIVKDPRYVNGRYINGHKTVFHKNCFQIEKQTAEEIATELRAALEQYHHAWYTPIGPDHLEEEIDHIQAELKQVNFEIIQSSEEVRGHFAHSRGSTLLVIDSMSPMSDSDGPKTRSAVIQALKDNPKQPRYRITIMAGVNRQAIRALDEYVQPYRNSTPTIALIVKDPRYVNGRYINGHKTVFHKNCFQIEKQTAEEIATELRAALEQYHHA